MALEVIEIIVELNQLNKIIKGVVKDMVSKNELLKNYKEKLIELNEDEVKIYIDGLTKNYVLALASKDSDELKKAILNLNESKEILKEEYVSIEAFINYSIVSNLRFMADHDSKVYVPESVKGLSIEHDKGIEELIKKLERPLPELKN